MQAQLIVGYTCAFTCGSGEKAVLVFRFQGADRALVERQRREVNMGGTVALFDRPATE